VARATRPWACAGARLQSGPPASRAGSLTLPHILGPAIGASTDASATGAPASCRHEELPRTGEKCAEGRGETLCFSWPIGLEKEGWPCVRTCGAHAILRALCVARSALCALRDNPPFSFRLRRSRGNPLIHSQSCHLSQLHRDMPYCTKSTGQLTSWPPMELRHKTANGPVSHRHRQTK